MFIRKLLQAEQLPQTYRAWCELCALLQMAELGLFWKYPQGLIKIDGTVDAQRRADLPHKRREQRRRDVEAATGRLGHMIETLAANRPMMFHDLQVS